MLNIEKQELEIKSESQKHTLTNEVRQLKYTISQLEDEVSMSKVQVSETQSQI